MREIMYVEALREGLREEMKENELVFLLGEDIGPYGGAFKVTQGLIDEFGHKRVRDTPISESAIVGTAVGAALTGMRPIVEIMFGDLTALAMDQICNQAAKIHYMFGGQSACPMVLRTPFGGGVNIAEHHSQSLEAWFVHIPGLKVVAPSTPYDAKGLIKSSIHDDNPVIFCEHKQLYRLKGPVPKKEYIVPIGKGDLKREGDDVTIIATSWMVQKALNASAHLKDEGISVEVLDPRTIRPLDREVIKRSIMKTNRTVVVSEGYKTCGITSEITSVIVEEAFDYLDAPIIRIANPGAPIPFSPPLENYVIPNENMIVNAVKKIVLGKV